MIITIIAINVGMFILSILLNPRAAGLSLNPLTFLSPSGSSLELLCATVLVLIHDYQR